MCITTFLCSENGLQKLLYAYFASPVSIPVLFGKPLLETATGILADDPPPVDPPPALTEADVAGFCGKGFVVPLLEPPTGLPRPWPNPCGEWPCPCSPAP